MGFNPCKGFGVIGARILAARSLAPTCFNPCKGFGVIGVYTSDGGEEYLVSFNPCKGFGVIGGYWIPSSLSAKKVSIPVRVLG